MVVSDDRVFLTVVDSHTSSSANGKSHEIIAGKNLNKFVKFCPKNKLVHTNLEKEKKQQGSSNCEVSVELSKSTLGCKALDSKKQLSHYTSTRNQSYKKQPRKCDNPVRLLIKESSDHASILSCKNSACKAILSSEDKFCKKCSCCICHLFDDKKDPSLWLVCTSEAGDGDWCGLSCHIECALQNKKAGVVDLGQFMQLDGSYCCASCGKVSDIIGFWKQQLAVAKDAHQVDILCYRISLSYRLLNGTSKFKELHNIVEVAMGMLETEVGPVNGVSARIFRGYMCRISVVNDLQRQCSFAIMKAEECLNYISGFIAKRRDSPPAACTFHFEEISSYSLLIVFDESFSSEPDVIKGYKLWYCRSREEMNEKDPILIPISQQRIMVPNLQPCTEYVFRIMPVSDNVNLGRTESKCFTKSVDTNDKGTSNNMRESERFKVRNLGKIFGPGWAQEEGSSDELYQDDDVEEESCIRGEVKPLNKQEDRPKATVPHQIDLNVASVPDLNDDLCLPMESSPMENGCTLAPPDEFSFGSNHLDDNYEYCVNVIRWLECLGHIEKDFRLKFLTWFSIRSTEQERWVVITFIRTLIEEPSCLAGQLLDAFLEIVNCKRPRNGFCSFPEENGDFKSFGIVQQLCSSSIPFLAFFLGL